MKHSSSQFLSSAENTMQKIHYESYDKWIENFSINLNLIWNGNSAKNINKFLNNEVNETSSAIVIGRGPSIKKNNHLKMLAESNYDGTIVCCDGALIEALKNGITPEKFKKFIVTSIEPYRRIEKYYLDELVKQYGDKISVILPVIADPNVVAILNEYKMNLFWIHLLFDLNEGKKSFNYITSQIIRSKNNKGLPAIQTGANVGTSSWFIAWKILDIPNVCLIGINHGWEEDDPIDKIMSHGYEDKTKIVNTEDNGTQKFIKKIFNPDFKCYCLQDPIYQFYSESFKEFISRSPSWVNTINATEGGAIFGDRILCIKFSKFLDGYTH
jgi:hypothetical protein